MIAIPYNKTQSANGKDKVVVRFLLEEVGNLLVKYLSLMWSREAFIAEQIKCNGFENYEDIIH